MPAWARRSRNRSNGHLRKPRFPRLGFLTADFADLADEEAAVSLSDLPGLLFQAIGFVMDSGIAPRGGNHGWTRIHTDPVLWSFGPLYIWTLTSG